ncbi:ORF6C domain-containing protein [Clostridium cagae]|uniref:ORF6C domain-containing protein n=1 Tax=Clostridium cagae TaxID=2080751 RepID=UPI003F762CAD
MNRIQIFNNKNLSLKVRTFKNNDGSISINAEDTARGFGWIDNSKSATNGAQLSKVRWSRINGYIKEFGFSQEVAKDDYIPESLFYMLGMKASNKIALEFQKWLAIDVIPKIRKNGVYKLNGNQNLSIVRAEITALVNDIVQQKVNEIEEKCSSYYRPSAFEKSNISHYIKKRLGIKKANEEYELVKERILIRFGATKWEDISIETLRSSLNLIDESIRIIKLDRPDKQLTMFA